MIDSINFLIRRVRLRIKKLKSKGICFKKFESKKKNGFKTISYSFNYKGIEFKYNLNQKLITIMTTAHKVLNKRDIKLSDLDRYLTKVKEVSEELFGKNKTLELNRIDYCVDVELKSEEELECYLDVLDWNKKKYKYMKEKYKYSTSKYLQTKNGQHNLNAYDRGAKTKKKEDKNILRIELQCKKSFIKKQFVNYGIEKDLYNYWSKSSMEKYYFDYLKDYLYVGDNYTLKEARKIINNSNYKDGMKKKLKKFMKDVLDYTLDALYNSEFCVKQNLEYTYGKINNYIKKLNEIGVSPIPLKEYQSNALKRNKLKSLFTLIKEKAEKVYFK